MGWRKVGAFVPTPNIVPPTCLPLWGRWQAERPDGEGAHAVLSDQRFQNTERRHPLSHGPSVFKIRNAATLSVTAPAGPCQLSHRESQGRTACAGMPFDAVPPTCLPLWGRWHGERRDGEGARVVFCVAFSKYGTALPSQSRPLRVRASSPIGRAKSAGRKVGAFL